MMMKKLIPAAVILACMGAAQAQVSIYGLIDVSYGKNVADDFAGKKATFHSGGDGAEGVSTDNSSQGNSATKVGLKGSKEVATGLKANFQLETGGITSDGEVNPGGPFFNRQAWLGLSGGFGEVRLGKQDSVVFQTMVGFDFNGAANAASAQGNSGAGTWATGRQSRSLQYISPSMSGFKLQAGFVPEGNAVGDKANYSLGLSYAAGPFAAAIAGESKRTDAGNSFGSIAGSYDLGVAKVMVGYADGGTDAKGASVGVVAPVAGFNIGLNYSKNSDTDVTATEFFINREIFKNTYAYFDYGHVSANKTSTNVRGNAYALGAIYTF